MPSPQCVGCGQEIAPGSGRLCLNCCRLAWANDGDIFDAHDAWGDTVRRIAQQDNERLHEVRESAQ